MPDSVYISIFSTLEIIFCALLAENYFVKVLIPFIGVKDHDGFAKGFISTTKSSKKEL